MILPNDGKPAHLDRAARPWRPGIPVINLDRIFDTPLAYRTWIGGDNYGMGVSAGHYIGEQLKAKGVANPIIGEIAGHRQPAADPGTAAKGFADALKTPTASRSGRAGRRLHREAGQRVAANLLQAAPKLDALWNHDDDQGIGVLAAIKQAGRDEFFMVGGAGSANAMRDIKADNTVLKATVTYSPTMASSAIALARLVGQNKGMGDLVEKEVPTSITLYSADDHQGERRHLPAARLRVLTPWGSRPLGVGMVGYAFMGAAHSQAWRTAEPVLRPAAAAGHGRALRPRRGRGRGGGPEAGLGGRSRPTGSSC